MGRLTCPPRENLTFAAIVLTAIAAFLYLPTARQAEADTHAAAEARQELRIQAAAAQACPKGYAVHWVGERQMECLKELP